MNQTIYIEVGTKKYPLVLSPCIDEEDIRLGGIHIKCEIAGLDQTYALEDLPLLLKDLPGIIEENLQTRKDANIPVRFSAKERLIVEKNAKDNGFNNISSYIRARSLQLN